MTKHYDTTFIHTKPDVTNIMTQYLSTQNMMRLNIKAQHLSTENLM